jgi:hypothetical protein
MVRVTPARPCVVNRCLQARHQQSTNPLTPVSAFNSLLYVFVRIFVNFSEKIKKKPKKVINIYGVAIAVLM